MKNKKPMPLIILIFLDIIALGISVLIFAFFHHVRAAYFSGGDEGEDGTETTFGVITKPRTTKTAPQTASAPNTTSPGTDPVITLTDGSGSIVTVTTEPVVTEPPDPYDRSGDFGEKFAEFFSIDDEIYTDEDTYRSHDIYIKKETFSGKMEQKKSASSSSYGTYNVTYYFFDIYVRNIENFMTSYSTGGTKSIQTLSENMILSITGDNYRNSEFPKYVVRNGVIVKDPPKATPQDLCVLYWDGVMETYAPGTYEWEDILKRGPYQAWTFGPILIDENGNVPDEFNTSVYNFNPRSAVGYIEPGHYAFISVDGRSQNKSNGVNMDALARIMKEHGCTAAYNLDGGASSQTVFNGEYMYHSSSYRNIYDVLCIGEVTKE